MHGRLGRHEVCIVCVCVPEQKRCQAAKVQAAACLHTGVQRVLGRYGRETGMGVQKCAQRAKGRITGHEPLHGWIQIVPASCVLVYEIIDLCKLSPDAYAASALHMLQCDPCLRKFIQGGKQGRNRTG
eukprot:scaffold260930_cov23-Tisochrysis_lutea.AAC.1